MIWASASDQGQIWIRGSRIYHEPPQ
jgi:hypothetical protein